jgi:hypothetical protein
MAQRPSQPVAATSGGGDQGSLALGSNPWYVAGSLAANTAAVSSAPTVIQASPNYGNFVGHNGADHVLFAVDARPNTAGDYYVTYVDGIRAYAFGSGSGVSGVGSTGVFGSGTTTGISGNGVTGVEGIGSSTGVEGTGGQVGVRGTGANNIGVQGIATRGVGGWFQGSAASVRLVPGTLASTALTTTGHQAGEMYVTSENLLYFFDGTHWRQVLLAPLPGTITTTGTPPTRGTPPPVRGAASGGTQEGTATPAVPPAAVTRPSGASTTTQPVPPEPPPRP